MQTYFPILENKNYFEKRTVLYGYCTKEYKLFKVTSGIPTKLHAPGVTKLTGIQAKNSEFYLEVLE